MESSKLGSELATRAVSTERWPSDFPIHAHSQCDLGQARTCRDTSPSMSLPNPPAGREFASECIDYVNK